jgi:GNAT superfamily N-acetyltransferase
MELTVNRWDCSEEYKAELNSLTFECLGVSFEAWHKLGVWNQDYVCYSFLEAGRVLANASVYTMKAINRGVETLWYQLGAVATRKESQRKGLSRQILDFIFEHCPGEPFFLFAHEAVLDFYPRFGFRRIYEWQPILHKALNHYPGSMRQVGIFDPCIRQNLADRRIYSNVLDFKNTAPINWFHLLFDFSDCIYEIPALEAMIVARQDGQVLNLYDVVSKAPLAFEELSINLDFPGVRTIKFGFNPDRLGIAYQMVPNEGGSPIFVRGDLQLPEKFIFPLMART